MSEKEKGEKTMKKLIAALMMVLMIGAVCVAADTTVSGKVVSTTADSIVVDNAGKEVTIVTTPATVIAGADALPTTLDKVAKGANVKVVCTVNAAGKEEAKAITVEK